MASIFRNSFAYGIAKSFITCVCALLASCGGSEGGTTSPQAASDNASSSQPLFLQEAAISLAPAVTMALSAANVTGGQAVHLGWFATNATSCDASGAWNGTTGPNGEISVTQLKPGAYTYALTCTGPWGSARAAANLAVAAPLTNVAPVTIESGLRGLLRKNVPFVDVTICQPGTNVCQTVDHVVVDTGSFGLRVFAEAINPTLSLPVLKSAAGTLIGVCAGFGSGFMWGSVRQADIKIGGMSASGIPIELTGDALPELATIPSDCSSKGSPRNTIAAFGAKGLIGVGLIAHDCPECASKPYPWYYDCTTNGCTPTALALDFQVINPVAALPTDNNGIVMNFPPVTTAGATSVTGALIFGIGTRSNNQLGNAKIFAADNSANFITTYKGVEFNNSFIDSGSNMIFLSDTSIPRCSSPDIYCPSNPLVLSAITTSVDGITSEEVSFGIVNYDALPASVLGAHTGAPEAGSFVWGMPFFYGRSIFSAISGKSTPAGVGPYWAY